jgi:peptidoglycan hydrolase-like protein with peptidoglycan-binding domain
VNARRAGMVAGGLALAVAAYGIWSDDDTPAPARAAAVVATGSAVVETRTLIDREDVSGTLGFASSRTVGAASAGTLTRVAAEGKTVRRGGSLYAVDARSSGYVMYGSSPAWRALSTSVTDGDDVRQLERNLEALGYDPGDVDEDFDWETARAVRAWEDDRGVTEDGVVALGEVVFTDGPVRMGSRRRVVTARLPAGRQGLVDEGDRVTVTLPDGTEVRGTVTEVGRVATAGSEEGSEATVKLEVALRRGGDVRLDGAPVTVSVARTEATKALAVPVAALLAVSAGKYAVELKDGTRVAVALGAFADGYVEVDGAGLREGQQVVVPQ